MLSDRTLSELRCSWLALELGDGTALAGMNVGPIIGRRAVCPFVDGLIGHEIGSLIETGCLAILIHGCCQIR